MTQISETVASVITSIKGRVIAGPYLAQQCQYKNINVLGSGMYGVAIEDNGQVFKIFNTEEKGYGAFLQYLKGKSTVLNPRVKVVGTFGSYTCVHIERLHNFTDEVGEVVARQFVDWVWQIIKIEELKLVGDTNYKSIKLKFPQELTQYVNKPNMAGMLKKLAKWCMEYNSTLDYGIGFDLHNGNFMIRHNADGSKQIVLTDPFS